jgi:glycosyltransferase involved in cell wall biosynthesis
MKILFVSAVLPYPLYSGGQVRIYNLLKKLSMKHDITLYAFIRDEKEKANLHELSFCKKIVTVMRGRAWQPKYVLQSLFSSVPFLYATYNNKVMQSLLEEEVKENYDLIHLEPGYIWLSLPESNIPVVVSEHNIEHEVYEKYAHKFSFPISHLLKIDVAKMFRWEKYIWNKASYVTAASNDDGDSIKNITSKPVAVIHNGVDIKQFAFRPKKKIGETLTFLYVGTFAWMQNTDAVKLLLEDLWPNIQKKYPHATLRIVGKNPPSSLTVMKLANVTWLESVPNIYKEYTSADILLAPIRVGGGTKYKIIESMACGLPVITTTIGAQGIDISQTQKEIWIAQDITEICEAIDDIIRSPERLDRLKSARMIVEKKYSWDSIAEALDTVWKKVV